jgi:hypothetical protein
MDTNNLSDMSEYSSFLGSNSNSRSHMLANSQSSKNPLSLKPSSNSNNFSQATVSAIASSIVAAASHLSNNNNNSMSANNNPNNTNVVKNSIKLCRRRKARTVFSDQQLSGLEKRFESQKYLSTPERVELANSLGLSETQVIIKFNLKIFYFINYSSTLKSRR